MRRSPWLLWALIACVVPGYIFFGISITQKTSGGPPAAGAPSVASRQSQPPAPVERERAPVQTELSSDFSSVLGQVELKQNVDDQGATLLTRLAAGVTAVEVTGIGESCDAACTSHEQQCDDFRSASCPVLQAQFGGQDITCTRLATDPEAQHFVVLASRELKEGWNKVSLGDSTPTAETGVFTTGTFQTDDNHHLGRLFLTLDLDQRLDCNDEAGSVLFQLFRTGETSPVVTWSAALVDLADCRGAIIGPSLDLEWAHVAVLGTLHDGQRPSLVSMDKGVEHFVQISFTKEILATKLRNIELSTLAPAAVDWLKAATRPFPKVFGLRNRFWMFESFTLNLRPGLLAIGPNQKIRADATISWDWFLTAFDEIQAEEPNFETENCRACYLELYIGSQAVGWKCYQIMNGPATPPPGLHMLDRNLHKGEPGYLPPPYSWEIKAPQDGGVYPLYVFLSSDGTCRKSPDAASDLRPKWSDPPAKEYILGTIVVTGVPINDFARGGTYRQVWRRFRASLPTLHDNHLIVADPTGVGAWNEDALWPGSACRITSPFAQRVCQCRGASGLAPVAPASVRCEEQIGVEESRLCFFRTLFMSKMPQYKLFIQQHHAQFHTYAHPTTVATFGPLVKNVQSRFYTVTLDGADTQRIRLLDTSQLAHPADAVKAVRECGEDALVITTPWDNQYHALYNTMHVLWHMMNELGGQPWETHRLVIASSREVDDEMKPARKDLMQLFSDKPLLLPDAVEGRETPFCFRTAVMGHRSQGPMKDGFGGMFRFINTRLGVADVKIKENHAVLIRRTTRLLINEDEVKTAIEKNYGARVSIVDFATMTMREQAAWVRNITLLVGAHGAGITNCYFMHRNAAILQLHPYRVRQILGPDSISGLIWQADLGLRMYHWDNEHKENSVFPIEREAPWMVESELHGNSAALVELKEGQVVGGKTVGSFELNEYLKRQNTKVHIDEVGAELRKIYTESKIFFESLSIPWTPL